MKRLKKYPFLSIQKRQLQISLVNLTDEALPLEHTFFKWVWQAIKSEYRYAKIGIVFLDMESARQYNLDYREKDYATNILSFPYDELALKGHKVALQGDLLLCPEVVEKEALEQNKEISAHYAHLIVHGCLHLMGLDHEDEDEANEMESREIAILKQLGYANPYLLKE